MLSPQLLDLLRDWWVEGRHHGVLLPRGWLFPGSVFLALAAGHGRVRPLPSRLRRRVLDSNELGCNWRNPPVAFCSEPITWPVANLLRMIATVS